MISSGVLLVFIFFLDGAYSLPNALDALIGQDCDILTMNVDVFPWLQSMHRPILPTIEATRDSICVVAVCQTERDLSSLPEMAKMEIVIMTSSAITVNYDEYLETAQKMYSTILDRSPSSSNAVKSNFHSLRT